MAAEIKQVVDPDVSRAKFDQEIAEFRKIESDWRKKGIICLRVEFPIIELAFLAHRIKPIPVAFSVLINFTDYDVQPPSIQFIDVISGQPLKKKELNIDFVQVKETKIQGLPGLPEQFNARHSQSVLVGGPDDFPFLCLRGVREYHNHPTHTGDSWFLYRGKGEGKLSYLIDQLYNHSIPYAKQYDINMFVKIGQIL